MIFRFSIIETLDFRFLWWQSTYEIFDVDDGWFSLPLPDTFDQSYPLLTVQFSHQSGCLFAFAVQQLHYFFYREVYVDAAQVVCPAVFDGQAHTVKHQAVE